MPTLNHKIFNQRNYITAAIIAGFIFLTFVIFRSCDNSPDHSKEIQETKVLQQRLEATEQKAAADSVRQVRRVDSLQLINLDLQNKQTVITKELTQTKRAVQSLIAGIEFAKADNDTIRYIETCDSLKDLARLQNEIITMYQENDSIRTVNYEDQLSAKDNLLANRADLIAQLRQTNTETYAAFMQINTDYNKVTRKLKRDRTLSRILAAGAAVLGGVLLLK